MDSQDGQPERTRKRNAREPALFLSGTGDDYLGRWKRIIHLDQRLRSGDRPTLRRLASECGVVTKTIRRDFEAMRIELGAPIEYDAGSRGYRYADNAFAIPAGTLNERDLFALMVAENAIAQYDGTPLHDHLREAFDKMLAFLPGEVRDAHQVGARAIHFGGLPPPAIDPEHWTALACAIRDRRATEVRYQRGGKSKPDARQLHPYQLLVRDRDWFLIAHNPAVGRELLYYLPRIAGVAVLDEPFDIRDGFDAEAFHRGSFNAMQGPDEPVAVTLRFAPEGAHLVDERPWSPEQTVRRHKDGSASVTFHSAAHFEIERQVMRYGGLVEVVKPVALRERVRDTARRVADGHG